MGIMARRRQQAMKKTKKAAEAAAPKAVQPEVKSRGRTKKVKDGSNSDSES